MLRSESDRSGTVDSRDRVWGTDRVLAGKIDESTLATIQTQLRDESATVAAMLAACGEVDAEDARSVQGLPVRPKRRPD